MTVREIQGHLQDLYGVEVSPDLISRVTDAVLEDVREWQNRPLDPVYPVVFFDAPRVKIRDDGLVRNKAVYVALALDVDGEKHVLGLWIDDVGAREISCQVDSIVRSIIGDWVNIENAFLQNALSFTDLEGESPFVPALLTSIYDVESLEAPRSSVVKDPSICSHSPLEPGDIFAIVTTKKCSLPGRSGTASNS
jgi:hypothetical protein